MEYGDQVPSDKILQSIANYFRVPVSDFNCPAVTDQQPEDTPETQPIPTAVKEIYLRTSDGHICTEEYCGWRRQDGDTYFCLVPGKGCMKERQDSEDKGT